MTVKSIKLPIPATFHSSTSVNSQALDASNDGVAMVFRSPVTGQIEAIGFNVTASVSPPTYRCGIEGATATRQPDGTYKASGNAYVDVASPGTGWRWEMLGTLPSVTAGDQLAATIRYQTGTIGGSNRINIAASLSTLAMVDANRYSATLTAGVWAPVAATSVMAVRFVGGLVLGLPYSSIANEVWNSGSSPRYRGVVWTPEADMLLHGVAVAVRVPDNADFEVLVFEGASATPIATLVADPDVDLVNNSSVLLMRFSMPAAHQCTAGTAYSFVINPTTANSQTTCVRLVVPDAGSAEAWGRAAMSGRTTNSVADPISWTDTSLSYLPITPITDAVDIPAGGSGTRVYAY